MTGQVLQRGGHAVPFEIGGRGDDRQPLGRADADRDHVGLEPLAQPDAGVIPFGDDIDEPVLRDDIQHDVGKRAGEPRGVRRDQQFDRRMRRGQADRADGLSLGLARITHRIGDHVERGRQPVEQPPPGHGDRDATRGAVEQAHAELRLELADRVADRRGRHAQPPRRRAKPAAPRDRLEQGKAGKVATIHRSILSNSLLPINPLTRTIRRPIYGAPFAKGTGR